MSAEKTRTCSGQQERVRLERSLIKALTQACESAKSEFTGFCWLTHLVEYQRFPHSLRVIWIFDTQDDLDRLSREELGRVCSLTARACAEAGVEIAEIERHVSFDSEQACRRVDSGNWGARLGRLTRVLH